MHSARSNSQRRRAIWWAFVRSDAQSIITGGLLALFAIILSIGGVISLKNMAGDLAGAPLNHAEGVVTLVAYDPVHEGNTQRDRPQLLEVDGNLLSLGAWHTATRPFPPLNRGARVRYSYRVGKSGRWYLHQIELLPRHR